MPAPAIGSEAGETPAVDELLDLLYHHRENADDAVTTFPAVKSRELELLNRVYAEPRHREAFRNRRNHMSLREFVDELQGEPSRQAVQTQLRYIRTRVQSYLDGQRREKRSYHAADAVLLAGVSYRIEDTGDAGYIVQLAARHPEQHRKLAESIEQIISSGVPNCVVSMW